MKCDVLLLEIKVGRGVEPPKANGNDSQCWTAGVGLLSFNAAQRVPAAPLPLPMPAVSDFEGPRAGAPFRGCAYLFASDSALWQVRCCTCADRCLPCCGIGSHTHFKVTLAVH